MEPQNTPLPLQPTEKVIHPTSSAPETTQPNTGPQPAPRPTFNANHIYPQATRDIDDSTPSISAANNPTKSMADKTVAQRVKSLMILAIIGLVATVFSSVVTLATLSAIKNSGTAVDIGMAIYAVDFLIYGYLLFAKNPGSVMLLLKIMLVLELIGTFFDVFRLATVQGFVGFLSGAVLCILIYIALTGVRNLYQR